MLTVHKLKVKQDLAEETFVRACGILGVVPGEEAKGLAIICSLSNLEEGLTISRKYKTDLITLPGDLMTGGNAAWAVNCGSSWVWSEGF